MKEVSFKDAGRLAVLYNEVPAFHLQVRYPILEVRRKKMISPKAKVHVHVHFYSLDLAQVATTGNAGCNLSIPQLSCVIPIIASQAPQFSIMMGLV